MQIGRRWQRKVRCIWDGNEIAMHFTLSFLNELMFKLQVENSVIEVAIPTRPTDNTVSRAEPYEGIYVRPDPTSGCKTQDSIPWILCRKQELPSTVEALRLAPPPPPNPWWGTSVNRAMHVQAYGYKVYVTWGVLQSIFFSLPLHVTSTISHTCGWWT